MNFQSQEMYSKLHSHSYSHPRDILRTVNERKRKKVNMTHPEARLLLHEANECGLSASDRCSKRHDFTSSAVNESSILQYSMYDDL